MKLEHSARQAWAEFLSNAENLGHAERNLTGGGIDSHVQACWQSALSTAQRIRQDIPEHKPLSILEVGSSTGLNCLALQELWPNAKIVGVEPEIQAIRAAVAMVGQKKSTIQTPEFILGFGESLPLPDGSIDLIVCHTVIEHVCDVEMVVAEMARVLSPHGILHLEAPNYTWPYEPHLGIWCFPLLGKAGVKLAARFQGKKHRIGFIDHLKFVTPSRLERAFSSNKLAWENRVKEKLKRVLEGDVSHIKAYRRLAGLLRFLSRARLSPLLISFVMWSGLYSSVLYTVRKTPRD